MALIGAGNEARTRDLDLGKVALYQLSYTRFICLPLSLFWHRFFYVAATAKEALILMPFDFMSSTKNRFFWFF